MSGSLPPSREDRRRRILAEAWIGDAVLTLYARRYILARDGMIDQEKSVRLTSNRFLSALGEATEVEARIGRVYESQGLAAAFAWIESEIVPLFEKQEARRTPRRGELKMKLPPSKESGSL